MMFPICPTVVRRKSSNQTIGGDYLTGSDGSQWQECDPAELYFSATGESAARIVRDGITIAYAKRMP